MDGKPLLDHEEEDDLHECYCIAHQEVYDRRFGCPQCKDGVPAFRMLKPRAKKKGHDE